MGGRFSSRVLYCEIAIYNRYTTTAINKQQTSKQTRTQAGCGFPADRGCGMDRTEPGPNNSARFSVNIFHVHLSNCSPFLSPIICKSSVCLFVIQLLSVCLSVQYSVVFFQVLHILWYLALHPLHHQCINSWERRPLLAILGSLVPLSQSHNPS